MTDQIQRQSGRWLLGALAAAVLVVIGVFVWPVPDVADAPDPVQAAAVPSPLAAALPDAEPPAMAEAAPAPAPEAEPTVAPADQESAQADVAADAPMLPEFDTFRLDPDGAIIVAGRAAPGVAVALVLGGQELARSLADEAGNFVMLATAPPADQPRRLALLADPEGAALMSQTSYLVAPIAPPVAVAAAPMPEAAPLSAAPAQEATVAADPAPAAAAEPVQEVAVATAEPVQEGVATTEPVQEAPAQAVAAVQATPAAPVAADLPAPVAAGEPVALADLRVLPDAAIPAGENPGQGAQVAAPVVVLQSDQDGVRVVQGAAPTDRVALDAITYDPYGTVRLAGRGGAGGAVQIYLDDAPIRSVPVNPDGRWQLALDGVAAGSYRLRIDELGAGGRVLSRLETPFRPEAPATVAAVLAAEAQGSGLALRTVQPGSTLWAIAEEALGSGILYVQVFAANSDQIRDPDLIYPGQVFRIPLGADQ